MKRLFSAAFAAVSILLSSSLPVVAHQPSATLVQKAPKVGVLSEAFKANPEVRIIVQHATPGVSGPLDTSSAASVAETVSANAVAQGGIVASFVGGDADKAKRWDVRRMSHLPMMVMTVTAAEAEALAQDPRVEKIWADEISRPTLDQSVPLIGMTGTGGAYANGAEGTNTAVAVLDTGVDSSHPFMAGKVVDEACFSTTSSGNASTTVCPNGSGSQTGAGAGTACASSVNGCNHGTHVAGIVAGRNSSGSPASGVAREAKIIAVQVFSRFDNASLCNPLPSPCALSYNTDQLAGLNHVLSRVGALAQTIASVNMSLGGGYNTGFCDSNSLKPAVDSLRSSNVATVIASGNNGFVDGIGAPSCISTAITVGSTTKSDVISSFSNSASMVDLLAPGTSINSSVPGSGYAFFSGTSMATPHVAGAFAAIRSRLPSATVTQIETALKNTGTLVADTRSGGTQTKPRIRVDLALNQLLGSSSSPALTVSAGSLVSSGNVGGPFSPSSTTFTVTNSGTGTLSWTAGSSNTTVASVSPASGSLGAGGSASVTVAIASGANGLTAGSYSSTISFNNTNNSVGNTTRSVSLTVNGPSANNDNFANAITLSGLSGSTTGNNASATRQSGEPIHYQNVTGNKSVWWRWTPSSTGHARISLSGSGFDTVLAVYTGSSLTGLTQIASNDDSRELGSLQSLVDFEATSGTAYYIAVDTYSSSTTGGSISLAYSLNTTPGPAGLFSAVLPYARSVQVGTTVTAFANIFNTTSTAATNCYLQLPTGTPGQFFFRPTTPSNQIDSSYAPNDPVTISAGSIQNFVFAYTPSSTLSTEIRLVFSCSNKAPVTSYNGVNTFILSATSSPGPDVVVVGATPSNDGIVNIPGNTGTGLLVASGVNIGTSAPITVSADTGSTSLPVVLTVCQTNPSTGACLSPPGASTTSTLNTNSVATYSVFVRGTGNVAFDPANRRIFLRFRDSGGVTRGATNVAVRTDTSGGTSVPGQQAAAK